MAGTEGGGSPAGERVWARPDGQLLQALHDVAAALDRLESSHEALVGRLSALERSVAPGRTDADPALTPSQVAEQLGVSVRWVYELLRERQVAHVRLEGQGLRVRQSALEAYLAARTVPAQDGLPGA